MTSPTESTVYESSVRFDEGRIRAAAVYCSDGRFGEQIDDFLHNGLLLPRCDRLVVPGGAACLAGHHLAFREEDALIEQLRFLKQVHDIGASYSSPIRTALLRSSLARARTAFGRPAKGRPAGCRRAASLLRSPSGNRLLLSRKHPGGTVRFESLNKAVCKSIR